MSNALNAIASNPLVIKDLLINLALGTMLALLLRIHYRRFCATLANRVEFSNVLVFILLTTLLIISIVKSSLALTLGLVGALSIVRFRTPIKEPEELAYLFLAIAIGLGLGADQRSATVVATVFILLIIAIFKWAKVARDDKSVFFTIEIPSASDPAAVMKSVTELMAKNTRGCDLRRFDVRAGTAEISYVISMDSQEKLAMLISDIKDTHPAASISFIDQSRMPGI